MADMDKLRGRMAERRMTGKELAARLGKHPASVSRMLRFGRFKIADAENIAEALGLSGMEAAEIFFAPNRKNATGECCADATQCDTGQQDAAGL